MSQVENENESVTGTPAAGAISAPPGRYYRIVRFLVGLLFFGFGVMCIYDGYYKYPRDNEQNVQEALDHAQKELGHPLSDSRRAEIIAGTPAKHGAYDIPLNRGLGVILPPLSLLLIVVTLYSSRGRYHLENDTLELPGHPPIPLESIRRLDKTRWDRKGIADIAYELADGRKGTVRIDAFHYEQAPTDAIMDRISAYIDKRLGVTPEAEAETETADE